MSATPLTKLPNAGLFDLMANRHPAVTLPSSSMREICAPSSPLSTSEMAPIATLDRSYHRSEAGSSADAAPTYRCPSGPNFSPRGL